MIVSAILKAIFFYFLFVFIRKLVRGHRTLKTMGEGFENARQDNRYNHSYNQTDTKKYNDSGSIEAEFRHLD